MDAHRAAIEAAVAAVRREHLDQPSVFTYLCFRDREEPNGPVEESDLMMVLILQALHRTRGYRFYLRTDTWREVRDAVIRRASERCQLCGKRTRHFNVHHNNYERVGHERPSDLIALCRDCHRQYHGIPDQEPTT